MNFPQRDADRFFEILMPMLEWMKRRRDVKAELKKLKAELSPNYIEDQSALTILWKRPELIDEYLQKNAGTLSREEKDTLSAWRKEHINGPFIIERFLTTGTVFISAANGQVYLVSGITSHIEESLSKDDLPCMVQTALIPYKGRIVYDSAMRAIPNLLGGGAGKQELKEIFMTARRQNRIVKTLPTTIPKPDEAEWLRHVSALMPALAQEYGQSPAEVKRALLKHPDANPISQKDRSTITRLLKQPLRSEEDWDVIKDILAEHDIFTAVPTWETKTVKDVERILCKDNALFVFTTFDKCQTYMKRLIERGECPPYYHVSAMPYGYVMQVADERGMMIYLDYPNRRRTKFITYNSERRSLIATVLA
jgi:hypothetical protein